MTQEVLRTPVSGAELVSQVNSISAQIFNIEEGVVMDNTKPFLGQFMDTVGDASGSIEMNVDGSTTPVTFRIKPPAGEVYMISRFVFSLADGGSLDSGGWGNNGGIPLTNGIELVLHQDGTDSDVLGSKLKTHYDLASMDYDVTTHTWGSGDAFLVSRFTFTKGGVYVKLDGDKGDEMKVIVSDDLTHLKSQRVSMQGYIDA